MNKSYSDHEILEGLRSGNSDIIKNIYDSSRPEFEHLLISKGASKLETQDLFMDSLESIYFKLQDDSTFALHTESFKSYLCLIPNYPSNPTDYPPISTSYLISKKL